ncbi:hypothetical protein BPAE_0124g00290 [Botrytis paeoniae]|uniref:MARVEL domain-containing protein n=1 Tax=Botrytis paeoniae TaxID=278948 RepID=A0A4Z1FPS3_9HELO|nr:hypothetical protein BPAE_0124g00290 [Botrytis paeoniae]
MHGTDILALVLRVGQFAFSTIVVGLTSSHLHSARAEPSWSKKRFIYTDVIAALGLFFSLFFMLPFTWNFIHWPIDFLMFVMYMIAFGLLVDFITPLDCGSIFNWYGVFGSSACARWKSDVAFTFLASLFFLGSFLLGTYIHHRNRHTIVTDQPANGQQSNGLGGARKRWYRSRADPSRI